MLAGSEKAQDLNPWPGLTLACIRILQLYYKVFDQPLPNVQSISRYDQF